MAKVWFITGASSGLGEALARAVLEKGDKVVATFRQDDQASSFSKGAGENGLGVVMDVTNSEQITTALQKALDQFSRIDVLVNNAGYGTIGAIEEFSMDEIRQQMETNLFGAIAMTKALLPIMRGAGGGHIVQISSGSGFKAAPGFGVYNASKFALEGFSEALAQEVAPFNIRVVIAEPGPFRTQFLAGSMKNPQNRIQEYDRTPVANMYKYMERMNGKQEGDPVKAAKAIVDYVQANRENLRLPLGKAPLQAIRAKIADVQKDLEANESIAASAVFEE